MAAALGYTVHLLLLASKYLEVSCEFCCCCSFLFLCPTVMTSFSYRFLRLLLPARRSRCGTSCCSWRLGPSSGTRSSATAPRCRSSAEAPSASGSTGDCLCDTVRVCAGAMFVAFLFLGCLYYYLHLLTVLFHFSPCRAVLWLKRAVEQLLQSRGVTYEPNHHILSNVHNLFYCEMCPKIAI